MSILSPFHEADITSLEDVATLHTGSVQGAVFAIAMPKSQPWNSCLLIHAHGFRSEDTPLHAEVDDPFWWGLVSKGWAVAVTSYRRSGVVVGDAIKDINNLRNHICNEFGPPFWVFIDGRSMGGAISTRLAELPNAKTLYHGVMAIGAALLVKDDDPRFKLTHRPIIPIVYLTNTSELGPVEDYISKVKVQAENDYKEGRCSGDEVKIPALKLIQREGHNWTNPRERWAAFSLLVEWAFTGAMVTQYLSDGTQAGKAIPGVAQIKDGPNGTIIVNGKIVRVLATPRVVTNLTAADLATAGIKLMTKFTIANQKGQELEATFGAYPFVGIGDDCTVAAEDPEGYILFFDIAEYRNASSPNIPKMGFKVGDGVTIKGPLPPMRTHRQKIAFKRALE